MSIVTPSSTEAPNIVETLEPAQWSPRSTENAKGRASPTVTSAVAPPSAQPLRPIFHALSPRGPNAPSNDQRKYGHSALSPQTEAIIKSQRSQRISPATIGLAYGNGTEFSNASLWGGVEAVFVKSDKKASLVVHRSFSSESTTQYNLFGESHPFNEVFNNSPPPTRESRSRSGSGSTYMERERSGSVSYDTREVRSASVADSVRDRSNSNVSFETRSGRSASTTSFDADGEHDPYEYSRNTRTPELGMRHVSIGDQTDMFEYDNYNDDTASYDSYKTDGTEGLDASAYYGEHPSGEHPSRTLFVRNINSNVEDDELTALFEVHGPIRSMYSQCKHRGFVMISYYDIRHAKNAMRFLQGKILRRRKLDIHYSIPKENPSEKDQNQGTLVIFNLDPNTSNEELKNIFGPHGEIKEIRETPNKKHHKFIEFYDVRDAEKAMRMLNKSEVKGKKIKIEPSRPGGARRGTLDNSADDDPSLYTYNSYSDTSDTSDLEGALGNGLFSHFSPSLDRNSGPTAAYASMPPSAVPSPLSSPFIPSSITVGDRRRAGSNPPPVVERTPLNVAVTAQPFVPNSMVMAQAPPLSPLSIRPRSNSGNLPLPRPPSGDGRTLWASPDPGTMSGNRTGPPIPNFARALGNSYLSFSSPGLNTAEILGKGMDSNKLDKAGRIRAESYEDKSKYSLNLARVRSGEDTRTTLMIRNIPNKYTQKMLLQAVDEHHRGCYDFFYLPIDFKNKCNVGYAFINFTSPMHIIPFYNEINKKKWEKFNSEKVCELTYARIQGKIALIAHFQNSSLMCEDKKCRPIIFHFGEQEPFPLGNTIKKRSPSMEGDDDSSTRDA